jgi:ADP-ribose pyrophosphatase
MSRPESHPDILLRAQRFHVQRVCRTTADGHVREREIVRHPGAVTILPMVGPTHVCLIRNFRVSVDRWLVELPAGTLERGEDPREAAARELAEETGFRAAKLKLLHEFYLSPGILDERMHLYLARDVTPGDAARESGEEIENLITPWDQALLMVHDGTIQDAKTIVGLLYYDRLRR